MRVAAIYDSHGNLPALEAVLEEVRQLNVDLVMVGGDVVPGPFPAETLKCLLDLDVEKQFIYGNGEAAVLEQMAGREPVAVPPPYRPVIRWTAAQMSSHQQTLAAWPMTCQLHIPGLGEVLFCHAPPGNENEIFTRLTDEGRLLPVFAGVNASLVICGHTHMQFDRVIATVRVVNAGSVGMPFGMPGADWLLLDGSVQLRHTSYDLTDAARRIRTSGYPEADDFVAHHVINPPSEQQMLEAFSRAEVS